MNQDFLDEDGYPTDHALELIENWPFRDARGCFEFVKDLWYSADYGWRETDEPHEIWPERMVHRYYISTCGWSGNESIIRALENNKNWIWTLNWVQSRRGGHYIFELKEFNDE